MSCSPFEQLTKNSLDDTNWTLPIKISNGLISNHLSGIGMHEEAQPGKDVFDQILLPVPTEICSYRMYFPHNDHHEPDFSRDVVPFSDEQIWEMIITDINEGGNIILSWDNQYFGRNDKNLMLQDVMNDQLVDMSKTTKYDFISNGENRFRIYFGDRSELPGMILPAGIQIGNIYPNPASDHLKIPVFIPDDQKIYTLSVSLINTLGNPVNLFKPDLISKGHYTIDMELNGPDKRLSPGLYLVVIQVEFGNDKFRETKRIIIEH